MKYYSTSAVTDFIRKAEKIGYTVIQIEEGTCGHGHAICVPPEGHYWFEIHEHYVNEWTSGHTVRRTAKASKRMLNDIRKAYERTIEEEHEDPYVQEDLWEQGWTWDMY